MFARTPLRRLTVLVRTTRALVSWRNRRALIATVLFIALGTGCGSSAASQPADSAAPPESPGLDRVSNRGKPFSSLGPGDHRALERMAQAGRPVRDMSLLATRGNRAFYRLNQECYGIGGSPPDARTFSLISCSRKFPSLDLPILAFTVFGGAGGSGQSAPPMMVRSSEGVAADGIAKMAFLDSATHVVAEARVSDNIYIFDRVPRTARTLVAYDLTGEIVFSRPTP
jgi:hypothetical protein